MQAYFFGPYCVFRMASSYNRPKLDIHVVKCAPRTVLDFHVGGLIYRLV